jgi:hypothetical protein
MKRRLKPRRRGRPPKNDQLVVDLAAAFMEVSTLGPQQARDLALVWLQGRQVPTTRRPRGTTGRAGDLVGYELPSATFEARSKTIREKHLNPRPVVVSAFSQVLRELLLTAQAVQLLKRLK